MQTRVHRPTPHALRKLGAALRRGELVAIPTETVYGLAANALDAKACRRIFRAKRRPADDPLIVHVLEIADAKALGEFNAAAHALAAAFWPGPLTLVVQKKPAVPSIVTSGQPSVALRSPSHPLARELLRIARVPLAAPSANLFGYVSPTTAQHVIQGLGGRIEHVLDGGPCEVGVESTIVDVTSERRCVILRPGAITARDLRRALKAAGLKTSVSATQRVRAILAPGMLEQHYSPRTPFQLVRRARAVRPGVAIIHWRRPTVKIAATRESGAQFWMSEDGSPESAARNLYARLREADAGNFEQIVCEQAPASAGPLAIAINDRLRRAAGKRRK
jgi:L-threonylcarbamoyladenylate synthase